MGRKKSIFLFTVDVTLGTSIFFFHVIHLWLFGIWVAYLVLKNSPLSLTYDITLA